MDVQEKIIDLLTTKFDMPEALIRSGQSFDVMGLDSLVLLEVALAIKKETGVVLSEEELLPELTVTDLTALIHARLQEARRA